MSTKTITTGNDGGDAVNHPKHYNVHPSGIECIDIIENLSFCLGNAVKYLWRAGEKGPALEDLKKALWYVQREREAHPESRMVVTYPKHFVLVGQVFQAEVDRDLARIVYLLSTADWSPDRSTNLMTAAHALEDLIDKPKEAA